MMTQMGASNTLIQTMTPDRLRGRVMSVYSMMFMGMAPVGALLAGVVAERFGRAIHRGGRRGHRHRRLHRVRSALAVDPRTKLAS